MDNLIPVINPIILNQPYIVPVIKPVIIENQLLVVEDNPIVIEDESNLIEIKPDIIENESNIIEYKSNIIENKSVMTENKRKLISNKLTKIKKQTIINNHVIIKNKPPIIQPNPVIVENKSVVIEPKPVIVGNKSVVIEPKLAIVETKSIVIEAKSLVEKKQDIIKPKPNINKQTQVISIKSNSIIESLKEIIPVMPKSNININKISKKTIVFLGSQYRCPSIIFKLNLPDFTKIWLPGRSESYARQILNEECIEFNIALTDVELNSVSIKQLNDTEYDTLLINSYVILNQFTSSANNALLECIALNIPIFCNRLPAVEEYIGKDYPLYFKNIEDLEKLIYNAEKIKKAYEYLLNMNEIKKKLELDTFIHDILNSNITRSILR